MKIADLKNKSVEELKELVRKLQSEIHSDRQKAFSGQLKQVHNIGNARRTIAQIKTLLNNGSVK